MSKPLKKKGLTLIEIVISLAILSIAVIPLGNLALTSVKFEKDSDTKLKANTLSQQIIEYIKEPSVAISNIDNAIKDGDLGLSSFDSNSIKSILLDTSTEKIEDFFFYKTDVKDCYVKVRIDPTSYNGGGVVAEEPKDPQVNIWKNANFQYRVKIAKDISGNLKLYDVSGTTENIIAFLNSNAASIVLNITGTESNLSYTLYQDGQEKFKTASQSTLGKIPTFNLQIEEGSPNTIVNVENVDEHRTIEFFINELVKEKLIKEEPYVPNYKVYSKGKVGVYTKMSKEDENFSDVQKVNKVEVKVYNYKNGVKTLLQSLTDYKYMDVN